MEKVVASAGIEPANTACAADMDITTEAERTPEPFGFPGWLILRDNSLGCVMTAQPSILWPHHSTAESGRWNGKGARFDRMKTVLAPVTDSTNSPEPSALAFHYVRRRINSDKFRQRKCANVHFRVKS